MDIVNSPQLEKVLEDPLEHLPCSTIHEYRKGQTLYDQTQPSCSLYLILEGLVKVCRVTDKGNHVVMDIYKHDEFFGESALLGSHANPHSAVAIASTKVMTWNIDQLEEIMARRPLLAIALMQLFVKRSLDFGERIESLSLDPIASRLARALLRFSERMGQKTEDGSVHMMGLTHEFLAQYIGTSREIVTHYMNEFRRDGYVQYSRRNLSLGPQMTRLLRSETIPRTMAA
jgi:CRP-like cAMP-binding protein